MLIFNVISKIFLNSISNLYFNKKPNNNNNGNTV